MGYELNGRAAHTFIKWRADCAKNGTRDSKDRKIKAMSKLAVTRLKNYMQKFEPMVQQGMVRKSMQKGWTDLYAPNNTLDQDGSNGVRPLDMPIPQQKAVDLVDSVIATVKKGSPVIIRKERTKIAAILEKIEQDHELIKGSEDDPFWRSSK